MINHLLLTTDFSPEAETATALALDFAARFAGIRPQLMPT